MLERRASEVSGMAAASFYRRVIEGTGRVRPEVVERATAAVLHALRDRLSPEEARRRRR